MYTWFKDKRSESLEKYIKVSQTQSVPLINGEFGENNYVMIESTLDIFKDPEYNLAGWYFWTWKKVENRYPYLYGIKTDGPWEKVANWLEKPYWPNNRPTREETISGMNSFIEAVKLKNNVIDEKMKTILF